MVQYPHAPNPLDQAIARPGPAELGPVDDTTYLTDNHVTSRPRKGVSPLGLFTVWMVFGPVLAGVVTVTVINPLITIVALLAVSMVVTVIAASHIGRLIDHPLTQDHVTTHYRSALLVRRRVVRAEPGAGAGCQVESGNSSSLPPPPTKHTLHNQQPPPALGNTRATLRRTPELPKRGGE